MVGEPGVGGDAREARPRRAAPAPPEAQPAPVGGDGTPTSVAEHPREVVRRDARRARRELDEAERRVGRERLAGVVGERDGGRARSRAAGGDALRSDRGEDGGDEAERRAPRQCVARGARVAEERSERSSCGVVATRAPGASDRRRAARRAAHRRRRSRCSGRRRRADARTPPPRRRAGSRRRPARSPPRRAARGGGRTPRRGKTIAERARELGRAHGAAAVGAVRRRGRGGAACRAERRN